MPATNPIELCIELMNENQLDAALFQFSKINNGMCGLDWQTILSNYPDIRIRLASGYRGYIGSDGGIHIWPDDDDCCCGECCECCCDPKEAIMSCLSLSLCSVCCCGVCCGEDTVNYGVNALCPTCSGCL